MPAARIAQIQDMIAARDEKPGYKRNVIALKAELARLTEIQDLQTFAAPPEAAGVSFPNTGPSSAPLDSQDSPAA